MPRLRAPLRWARWSNRRGSIRTQLIVWNIVVLALLLGAFGLIIHIFVRALIVSAAEQQLDDHVRGMATRPPHFFPGDNPGDGGPPPRRRPDSPQDDGRQDDGGGEPERRADAHVPPDGAIEAPDARNRPDEMPPHNDDERHLRNGPQGDPHHDGHPPGMPPDGGPDKLYFYDTTGRSVGRVVHRMVDQSAFNRAVTGQRVPPSLQTVDNEISYVVTQTLYSRDHRVLGVVQGFRSLAEIYELLATLDRILLALIPIGLLGAGMAGAYLTDRVLRRVRGLTEVAGLIGARNLAERLPVTGNDEFSELAGTFNSLLGRLEAAFAEQQRALEQQRRFTADASHELKTPLTIIKGNTSMALDAPLAEVGYRQTLQDIDRAADTMSSLVQDLLLLARSDGGQLGKDRIELLVREVLERAIAAVAHRRGAPIGLEIAEEALSVPGNEGELVRLFTNLLDNATRYTPADGRIAVKAIRQGNRVAIAVADTGRGIAPEHLPHLGERFYRIDEARSRPAGGTGLGLSICKSIVEAHHGTLSFQSQPGAGTVVTVTLPAA